MSDRPAITVVVPLFNEEANVQPLLDATQRALGSEVTWELLLIDDGSSDGTAAAALRAGRADARVRVIRLARNFGQTAAMQAGFDLALGDVVVTMDGDLQNDPADIPRLVAKLHEGYDLVAGWRERRQDRFITRRIPSWLANRLIRWLTGVPIRDNGCSLRAYRRELLERVRLYSDLHRFIPAVAAATGAARIAEIPVRHHPRRRGRSKYGLTRVPKVLADLLTIHMIRSFRERPLILFGLAAIGASAVGAGFAAAAIVSLMLFRPEKAYALVLPAAALLSWGLAFYLLMLGLLGEVAVREQTEAERGPLPVVHQEAL